MDHRDARLLHRRRCQRGKADDVAGGVDVRHAGLIVLVDDDQSAVSGLHADGFEIEIGDIAVPAGGVEDVIDDDAGSVAERESDFVVAFLDRLNLAGQMQRDAQPVLHLA